MANKVRVPELLIGILVVAGCALGVLVWHQSTLRTRQALVLVGPISRGHLLTEADFAAADVSATGMALVAYEDRARMIGRFAVADLAGATPLTDSVAVESTPLPDGEALVGQRLAAGDFPAGLAPGDSVEVVLVGEQPELRTAAVGLDGAPSPAAARAQPAPGAPGEIAGSIAQRAVVEAIDAGPTSDVVIVTLRVPADVAGAIAASAETRLVQVGR